MFRTVYFGLAAAVLALSPDLGKSSEPIDIMGKWQCDYGIRELGAAEKSSAAWFQVTFGKKNKFHGAGKALAAGSALPLTLRGKWSVKEGVLKMIGTSEIANQQLPFRFVSDILDGSTMGRVDTRGTVEYRTACDR